MTVSVQAVIYTSSLKLALECIYVTLSAVVTCCARHPVRFCSLSQMIVASSHLSAGAGNHPPLSIISCTVGCQQCAIFSSLVRVSSLRSSLCSCLTSRSYQTCGQVPVTAARGVFVQICLYSFSRNNRKDLVPQQICVGTINRLWHETHACNMYMIFAYGSSCGALLSSKFGGQVPSFVRQEDEIKRDSVES